MPKALPSGQTGKNLDFVPKLTLNKSQKELNTQVGPCQFRINGSSAIGKRIASEGSNIILFERFKRIIP